MNIIVVSNRLAKAVTLGPREIAWIVAALMLVIGIFAFSLGAWLSPASTSTIWKIVPGAHARQAEIDTLAKRLGELQAKLIRMDGLVERMGKQTGVDVSPYLSKEPAARGGASRPGTPLSANALAQELTQTDQHLASLIDQLTLGNVVLQENREIQLPLQNPLPSARQSSSFGWRLDPFNGRQVFHEGQDLLAEIGTPIHAAGSGKVIYAAYHYQYGNMIDLDHGNGLVSRYAHSQRLNVKEGDQVRAGQVIAFLGNTGQSTGPHLHFELRYKGVPQNPLRFLVSASAVVNTARSVAPK